MKISVFTVINIVDCKNDFQPRLSHLFRFYAHGVFLSHSLSPSPFPFLLQSYHPYNVVMERLDCPLSFHAMATAMSWTLATNF